MTEAEKPKDDVEIRIKKNEIEALQNFLEVSSHVNEAENFYSFSKRRDAVWELKKITEQLYKATMDEVMVSQNHGIQFADGEIPRRLKKVRAEKEKALQAVKEILQEDRTRRKEERKVRKLIDRKIALLQKEIADLEKQAEK